MNHFRCIAADPAWNERGGGRIKRGADRHYALLKTRDIPRVMMAAPVWRPADQCHLWLWVTNNRLPDGLWVMGQLGFTYKTNWSWSKWRNGKLQIGLGQYQRGTHELLLFGTRGKAMVPASVDRLASTILAERTRHSAKPAEAYAIMERVSPGPRLEMFARGPRPGWTVWGREAAP